MTSLEERRDNMRVTFGLFTMREQIAHAITELPPDHPVRVEVLRIIMTPVRDLA